VAVRRSASTAAPLIVLVTLLLGLAGTLGSIARATAVERERATAADLVVETTGAAAGRVAAIPGVAVTSPEVTVPALLKWPFSSTAAPTPRRTTTAFSRSTPPRTGKSIRPPATSPR
jgi:hypothetical protein